ncbi:hypothetical protein Goarm_022506, partial [Gossypium armourianum]|nr:hypothetical protein [Gossypium armourianum]
NQSLFVRRWRALWRDFGGKRATKDEEFLGVIGTKCYSDSIFLSAKLGNVPSYTWSVWVARGLLKGGLCWWLGTRREISVFEDAWVPEANNYKVGNNVSNSTITLVADLINNNTRTWKVDVVRNIFTKVDASRINKIPLVKEAHEGLLVWRGEPSREFSVCSSGSLAEIKLCLAINNFELKSMEEISGWMKGKKTRQVMVDSIFSYIRELDGLKEKLPERGDIRSSSRLLLRDALGGVLVSASVLNNNVSSVFATKALACVQAMRLGTELGLASVVVEGDSLSIIKKCQSNEIDKSEIGAYVRDIQHYQRGFHSVCFKYTLRKTNLVAHNLAKASLKEGKHIYLVGGVPMCWIADTPMAQRKKIKSGNPNQGS